MRTAFEELSDWRQASSAPVHQSWHGQHLHLRLVWPGWATLWQFPYPIQLFPPPLCRQTSKQGIDTTRQHRWLPTTPTCLEMDNKQIWCLHISEHRRCCCIYEWYPRQHLTMELANCSCSSHSITSHKLFCKLSGC